MQYKPRARAGKSKEANSELVILLFFFPRGRVIPVAQSDRAVTGWHKGVIHTGQAPWSLALDELLNSQPQQFQIYCFAVLWGKAKYRSVQEVKGYFLCIFSKHETLSAQENITQSDLPMPPSSWFGFKTSALRVATPFFHAGGHQLEMVRAWYPGDKKTNPCKIDLNTKDWA